MVPHYSQKEIDKINLNRRKAMPNENEQKGKELTQGQQASSPVAIFQKKFNTASVQEKFQNALDETAQAFVTSLIQMFANTPKLQKCDPNAVILQALTAATLKLPINKSLGFAWIIPYDNKKKIAGKWTTLTEPAFQMGYKGYIQLALRTGSYKHLNAGPVYKGELKDIDKLSGMIDISGEKESDEVVGFFAYEKLMNGFEKIVYGSVEEVKAHADKYSPSYGFKGSAWETNFNAMAMKTLIIQLLSKWGILSIEMITAINEDVDMSSDWEKLRAKIDGDEEDFIDVLPVQEEEQPEKKKDKDEGPKF